MSKNYGPKIHKSEEINTKNHFLVEFVWNTLSSNGKDMYEVEMHDNGFTCNCPAFKKCKHIAEVEKALCYDPS